MSRKRIIAPSKAKAVKAGAALYLRGRSAGSPPPSVDDNPELTETELRSLKRVPLAKKVRWKLEMSQEEFAEAYRIPLGTLRDWEQHRSEPDQAAVTLLQVIEADPKGILKALKKVPA